MPLGGEYEQYANQVIEVTYTDDKFTTLANDDSEDVDVEVPDVQGRPVRIIKEAAYEFFQNEITEEFGYEATGALRSAMDTELEPEQEAIGEVIIFAQSNSNEITVYIIINELDALMDQHRDSIGFVYSPVQSTDFLQKLQEMHDERRLQFTREPQIVSLEDDRPDLE